MTNQSQAALIFETRMNCFVHASFDLCGVYVCMKEYSIIMHIWAEGDGVGVGGSDTKSSEARIKRRSFEPCATCTKL
jgi:hypothetical protein